MENRDADGLFIYNCHRLILMFAETKEQRNDKDLRGIVGVVDIPYTIMKPMHNKQSFQDKVGIQSLIKTIGEYMECYSRYLNVTLNDEFWKDYGYVPKILGPPSYQDKPFRRKRMAHVKPVIQCCKCLKWRAVPFQSRFLDEPQFPPEEWACSMNPDSNFNECARPETLDKFSVEEYKAKQSNMREYEMQAQREHEQAMERERERNKFASLVQKENQTTKKTIPVFDSILSNGNKKRKDSASASNLLTPRNSVQFDDYAYDSDPEPIDTDPPEAESDDSRDRNYVPGRSSQSQRKSTTSDKNRPAKKICKDKAITSDSSPSEMITRPSQLESGRTSQACANNELVSALFSVKLIDKI